MGVLFVECEEIGGNRFCFKPFARFIREVKGIGKAGAVGQMRVNKRSKRNE
jgi:hypothetical protein